MDICQLHPDADPADWVGIERGSFEKATRCRYPWYRPRVAPEGQYAVCSHCDNPVQIVGLYSTSGKPYGRHLSHALPDLAGYDQAERDACLYYKPRTVAAGKRRPVSGKRRRKILRLLIEHFDHVVALLKQDTGVLFSQRHLAGMLDRFRGELDNALGWATTLNIPWIFAYFSHSNSLWWQYCRDDSGLPGQIVAALPHVRSEAGGSAQAPTTRFIPMADGGPAGTRQELAFYFTDHRMPAGGDGRESMAMVIWYGEEGMHRDLVTRVIEFDFLRFQALMKSGGPRRDDLLELARDKLGDLLGDV